MGVSQMYIAIVVLLVLCVMVFFVRNKKAERFTPLAGLAFVFIVVGIFLMDNRRVGYSLMVIGVVLAVIDMLIKRKEKRAVRAVEVKVKAVATKKVVSAKVKGRKKVATKKAKKK